MRGATALIDSPAGLLRATACDVGITSLLFLETGLKARTRIDGIGLARAHLAELIAQLTGYFAGVRTTFDLPVAPVGTPFDRAAWAYLRTVPFGDTRSYGQQARVLGAPGAARAVGRANGRNPIAILVPCHRVIGANRRLTGYAGGLQRKQWLLDHERQLRSQGPDGIFLLFGELSDVAEQAIA